MSDVNSTIMPDRESKSYVRQGYDYWGRFSSYWYQIKEIIACCKQQTDKILEIGPGNKFLSDYFLRRDYSIQTMDIDEQYEPDIVGTVLSIPKKDNFYKVVMAFQVLEHLPFEEFDKALLEMERVSSEYVIFSVPDVRYFFEFRFSFFSSSKTWYKILSFRRLTNRKLPTTPVGGHHWEIGRPGFSVKKIISNIPGQFEVVREYRIPCNPIHHIFVLKVKNYNQCR